ncbi:MAG: peptidoglycan DD-metalloendopeptidase family protein [Oscillospiraceae bacterium]|nr:peptidoglycan DD-metalloendopeptidase family protein [Oscillospiraceae bacterium]
MNSEIGIPVSFPVEKAMASNIAETDRVSVNGGVRGETAAPGSKQPVTQIISQNSSAEERVSEGPVVISRTPVVISRTIIPYDTKLIGDDTLFQDERRVVTEGKNGVITVTESSSGTTGNETPPEAMRQVSTIKPVTEVIAVGTKPLTVSRGSYVWPADSDRILSHFGPRNATVGSTNHKGLDIGGGVEKLIFAADGGEVIFSGWDGLFGNVVRIKHDSGDITLYAHCSLTLVSEGDKVYQGQKIAYMGKTGCATGVHLHFEIIENGVNIDPLKCLETNVISEG